MQPMLVLALIAFAFIFIFQAAMNLIQYKGIRKQYSEIRARCHYVSVGKLRRFGRVRMSLLGFTPDGILKECWLLSGITFFTRFKRMPKYEGAFCEDLPELLNPKNKDQACILQAVDYMQMRFENQEDDEEYFGLADEDEYEDEELEESTENAALPDTAR